MSICPECQFENAENAMFCGGCGRRIGSIASEVSSNQSEGTLVDEGGGEEQRSTQHTLIDEPNATPSQPIESFSKYTGASSQYEIIEEVGRGGMSVVYRARDLKLNREVAIKRLLPEFAKNEKSVRRLMAEARSIANLQHAHIVSVYDVDQDEEGPYIAMEYVAGQSNYPETLEDRVENAGIFKQKAAITMITKLCDAVALANNKGIVHRDIKPSNILITPSGEPKLLDFGIAHVGVEAGGATFSGVTREGAVMGTVDYMAPEQESDASKVDARTDVYGLGGVLNYCLTGRSARHYRESQVPERVRSVLSQALETDIEKRFKSAVLFAEALIQAFGGTSLEEGQEDVLEEEEDGLLSDEEFLKLGLPVLSSDIRNLLERKGELEQQIADMEKGVHPDIRDAWLEFQTTAQSEQEQLKRLDKIAPGLSTSIKQSIFSAVEKDEIGSDLSICSQFEKEPQQEVMQYVRQVRRFLIWKESTKTRRESFEESLLELSNPLREELMELTQDLRRKQEEDFDSVIVAFIERAGNEEQFPLQEWAKIELGVLRRGYLWSAADIFRKAESLHADTVAWLKARQIDTVSSIRDYLRGFSKGKFKAQAEELLKRKDHDLWSRARQRPNDVEGFRAYLDEFQSGEHKDEANRSIDAIESALLEKVEKVEDDLLLLEAVEDYRNVFPRGKKIKQVDAIGNELKDWLKIKDHYKAKKKKTKHPTSNTLQDILEKLKTPRSECHEFLNKWPNGRRSKTVLARIEQIEKEAWKIACDIERIEGFRMLNKAFNGHAYTKQCDESIDRLEDDLFEDAIQMSDDRASLDALSAFRKITHSSDKRAKADNATKDIEYWQKFREIDNIAAYAKYLELCKSDTRKEAAKARISSLKTTRNIIGFLLVLGLIPSAHFAQIELDETTKGKLVLYGVGWFMVFLYCIGYNRYGADVSSRVSNLVDEYKGKKTKESTVGSPPSPAQEPVRNQNANEDKNDDSGCGCTGCLLLILIIIIVILIAAQ